MPAYEAQDKTPFSNPTTMKRHNDRLNAGTVEPMKKPAAEPNGDEHEDIQENPEFQECISKLKELGATEEDVEQAMGWSEESADNGEEATKAAGMGLAGLAKIGA
jgi:hypothetical protein